MYRLTKCESDQIFWPTNNERNSGFYCCTEGKDSSKYIRLLDNYDRQIYLKKYNIKRQ